MWRPRESRRRERRPPPPVPNAHSRPHRCRTRLLAAVAGPTPTQRPLRCGAYTRAYINFALRDVAGPLGRNRLLSRAQEPLRASDYADVSTAPSFRFPLERVRALRQRKELLAREELARAISQRTGSQDRLRRVEEHLERTFSDQRLATEADASTITVSAAELLARQAFVEHVEAQRTMGMRELERHEADVADRDTQLGHAAREHEILERLKNRQRAEHEREVGRRESQQLDEIALERFRRSAA